MKSQISFFLPTRKGSQRIFNKNTRPFGNLSGGLLENKLRQLAKCKSLDEIVLSSNDELSISIAHRVNQSIGDKIRIIERPDFLCRDSTPLADLINYVPEIINNEHIIWGHVTTPFVSSDDYDNAISNYFTQIHSGYDTLVSVKKFQNFLIKPDTNHIFNAEGNWADKKWPRTQDLSLLYEINHAIFITSREVYLSQNDRVGNHIYFYEMNAMKSFDIDWEDDFLIAEAIYDKFFRD
jgi:CMP-N-acetylneuraminic acid synthetase